MFRGKARQKLARKSEGEAWRPSCECGRPSALRNRLLRRSRGSHADPNRTGRHIGCSVWSGNATERLSLMPGKTSHKTITCCAPVRWLCRDFPTGDGSRRPGHVGQPGFYDRIDVGNYPQARQFDARSVVIESVDVVEPVPDLLTCAAGPCQELT